MLDRINGELTGRLTIGVPNEVVKSDLVVMPVAMCIPGLADQEGALAGLDSDADVIGADVEGHFGGS